jgi:hypothetical protein
MENLTEERLTADCLALTSQTTHTQGDDEHSTILSDTEQGSLS